MMGNTLSWVLEALQDETALRIYFALGAISTLVACGFVAWKTSEYVTGGLIVHAMAGRKPTTLPGWRRRLKKLLSIRNRKLLWQFVWLCVAILFGAVIPGLALFKFGLNADWFFMTRDTFLLRCTEPDCSTQTQTEALGWYIASLIQTSLVADVFSQQIGMPRSAIIANPSHIGILSTIFAFRIFLQVYIANWLSISAIGFIKTLRSDNTKIDKQIEEAKKRIRELE